MDEEVQASTNSSTIEQDEIKAAEHIEVQEDVYLTQDLIDNCETLGYRKEVVAGAFYHFQKKEMTKTEFKETIEKFLKRKVG